MPDRFSQRDNETQRDPEWRIANSLESALIDLGDVLKKLPASTRLRRLRSAIAELQDAELLLVMLGGQVSCGPGPEPAQQEKCERCGNTKLYGFTHTCKHCLFFNVTEGIGWINPVYTAQLTQAAVGDLQRLGAIPKPEPVTRRTVALTAPEMNSWIKCPECGESMPIRLGLCDDCAERKASDKEGM